MKIELLPEERSQLIVDTIDKYSEEMAKGSHDAAASFLHALVPTGPDEGASLRVHPLEIAQLQVSGGLSREEVLATTVALEWAQKFNGNFGVGTEAGKVLKQFYWNRSSKRWFFEHLGASVQAALHPEGEYGQDAMGLAGHMSLMMQHYYELINLAAGEPAKSPR